MSKRPYKRYSREFKLEAIRLADSGDTPVTQIARKLELRVNQIYKWKKQLEDKSDNAFPGQGGRPTKDADKDAEIRRLEKALADSEEENVFLKKTALYFAKQHP